MRTRLRQYEIVEQLERHLGDPNDSDNLFSYRNVLEHDETETYPQELFDVINRWGYQQYHIPTFAGGRLVSLEQLTALSRSIARRDLTVAVANGVCLLGSIPVWLAGTQEQQQLVARLLSEHKKLGFALSEKEHGHDLLANELAAVRSQSDYVLNGYKWTVGHATRSDALSLYVRTSPGGGPRGHSMLFINKPELNADEYHHLPKIKTLGLRAHDLSGISFDNCKVSKDTLIGQEGDGLLLATRSTLITRSLCAGLMLGAADTALRTTLSFAKERQLYGKSLYEIENARAIMADVLLDIYICDCLTTATMRAWHFNTDQISVWSPIVKYMVPTLLESSIHRLVSVLGSRFFLREELQWGLFQKIYRDVPIINVFEGGSHSQLHGVALQLKQLFRDRPLDQPHVQRVMSQIFTLDEPITEFINPDRIELHSHGFNYALQFIETTLASLPTIETEHDRSAELNSLLRELQKQYQALQTDFNDEARQLKDKSAKQLHYAKRYFTLHTAATCFYMWHFNRDRIDAFFEQGLWLEKALRKLLFNETLICSQSIDLIAQQLERRLLDEQSFGIVPIQFAKSLKSEGVTYA
ncbi:acyl-CoA dehydrogenase [Paenibacillus sp. CCS19]|uniref:acyl-CoA dehydrogenase family protein n=1 Tax=Paenibacillus sp. CCS19 TaxID=3158387 RepID=UPI00256A525B|nr:acyl-CoA dehydrogenase family protein [Paenibacillus cellulosilyticus]GMK39954.1 acyl-CoA dehydrogenase [Paenibacillus cellulosilyticus]